MESFSIFVLFSVLFSSGIAMTRTEAEETLEEQSFFSGRYDQTRIYGDGQSVDLGGQNPGDIISFDLKTRAHSSFGQSLSDSDIDENDLYSPAFDGYEFKKYSDSKYDAFVVGTDQDQSMNGVAWGPKESPSNSTCKIRTYYHDVSFNGGLVTLMYDFTGFLVGDSLLMTAAHGLYRDVTIGDFDDGIDNKYIPGKVEVYGAIGMADSWGSSYSYYSKGAKVFFPSSYISYRSFADDWALMRLDRPLGRELSYRKLSTSPMNLSSNYRIIGYPSMNQFHLRMDVSSADYVVDSTRPMIEYSVSSVDGMSGSPFYSATDETLNVQTDSDGHSYLASRSAYGMHVCSNGDHTTSYAITFNSQIIDLVDFLNSKYKQDSDAIRFEELSGQSLGEAVISIGGGYNCTMRSEGCAMSGDKLSLTPGSYVSVEFPFPLNELSITAETPGFLPVLNVYCHSYDENYNYQSEIEPSGGRYTVSAYSLRSIDINYGASGNGATAYIDSISISIDWDFRVTNYSAPQYVQMPSFEGNCVSYAIEGVIRSNSGSVLPKRSDGSTLSRLTDLYPGMVVAGLTKALRSEYIEMEPIGKYEVCAPDSYKIAIICDPYRYYHVLRQNAGGAWSHYVIGEGVQCQDYEGDFIIWPDEARIVHPTPNIDGAETHFDASSFVGYFSIRSTVND